MRSTLIVGCGDLGKRIARILLQNGAKVSAIVRTPESAEKLENLGITPLQIDLDHPIQLIDVENQHICYLAPPPRSGTADQRMSHFLSAMHGKPARLLYLSTTGIYGDCHGEWIDETRIPAPAVDRAWRRLDAEQQVKTAAESANWHYNIVRVAGIYGPHRLPLKRLEEQQPMIPAEQAPWTNRIHVDDLSNICVALLNRANNGEIYNATDGNPGTMTDYFNRIADYAGLPHPPEIDIEQAVDQLSAGMMSYLRESRRISNNKLINELGIALNYPTLDDGLSAIFGKRL